MKLMLTTSIVSPHLLPMADCLAEGLGRGNFCYVATQPPLAWRQSMGWDSGENPPYVLRAGEREEDRRECERLWAEADVVVCCERELGRIESRLKLGKLTFFMSERWWKPPLGMARLVHPRFARMALHFRRLAESNQFHHLPIGAVAAADMKRWAPFRDRSWLWGYFVALPSTLPQVARRDAGLEVLYAGRMLGWKRVGSLIRAFGVLLRQDKTARLTLIGDGPKRPTWEKLARRLGLAGRVNFQSSRPMPQVWARMRSAHIFVLPSNAYEGWGAVVNEAMIQGCAVVVSEAAGSARTMLRHGKNGFLFPPGDWRQLGDLLTRLSADESLRLRLAQAGQRTITECWSPQVGAKRFVLACEALLSKQSLPTYQDGPMAPA
jgi:glycosyltransferase involved in cell wall biosynthesis